MRILQSSNPLVFWMYARDQTLSPIKHVLTASAVPRIARVKKT